MLLTNQRRILMLPTADKHGFYGVRWKPSNFLSQVCSGPEL